MGEKVWKNYRLAINGLVHDVKYNQRTIDMLFLPFLRRLTSLQQRAKRRILVYLVAPPGTGKTTLSLLLEKLSAAREGLTPIQAIGLDGFHYHSDYIRTHSVERDGKLIPMIDVKGCPETFDVVHLREKLWSLKKEDIRWPVYDRRYHDVVEDVKLLNHDIILLEGNWLLLREGAWQDIRSFADYTLFISAKAEDLRERLIGRKMRGGKTRQEAEHFYETSDKLNVEHILKFSWLAEETWKMLPDGDYFLQADAPKPLHRVNREALWRKLDVRRSEDDIMMESIQRQLAAYHATGQGLDSYMKGYAEGVDVAKKEILQVLYNSGRMSSKEILDLFHLESEELADILLDERRVLDKNV